MTRPVSRAAVLRADELAQDAAHWIDVAVANERRMPLLSLAAEWNAYFKLNEASALRCGERLAGEVRK